MNLSFTRGLPLACVGNSAVLRRNRVDAKRGYFAQQHNKFTMRLSDSRGVTHERGYTDIDGLITDRPGVVLCTQYADCVPLFVDPVHGAVALARGLEGHRRADSRGYG